MVEIGGTVFRGCGYSIVINCIRDGFVWVKEFVGEKLMGIFE